MKILDIIIPHETLDENAFTDMMAKGRQKVKDVANDVGERTGIRALRTRESNKIADYVDDALTSAGKDLKRSEGLAAAERSLLDIEKNISLEGLSKKRFDEMAEYLATKLKAQDRTLHDLESPIVALQNFIKTEPNPQAWMNSKQIKDNLFNNEFQDWLTKSTNARIKIKQEVELAPTAPPAPKSKEEKEAEKIANREKEVKDKELTAREKNAEARTARAEKLIKEIEQDSKAGVALTRWLSSLSNLDKAFLSAETIRIIAINGQRMSDIYKWESSGQIPQEVAQYFPEVKSPGTTTWGGPDKQTEYTTNEERVKRAAAYAKFTIARQFILQLGALGGGLLAGNKLIKLGGGTINYASQLKYILYFLVPLGKGIVWLVKKIPGSSAVLSKSDWISKISIETLKGISQAGKLMMIDYVASAVNPSSQPYVSAPLTDLSNKLSTVPAYKNLQIDHPPDINDAVLSLFTLSMWSSIEGFAISPAVKQIVGSYEASLVPIKIFLDTLRAIWDYINIDMPEVDIDVPAAGGKLPGVSTNSGSTTPQVVTEPPNRAPSDVNASQDQTSMSSDNSSTTSSDASQAKVPPVKTNKKLTPSDSGYLDESINESFKKRVAQLMKS